MIPFASELDALLYSLVFGGDVPKFYGTGVDGDFNSVGNVTWAVGADDGGPLLKQFTNFTLNAGHTLTTDRRVKSVIIYCDTFTLGGTVDLDRRGAISDVANAAPLIFPVDIRDGLYHPGKALGASYRNDVAYALLGGWGGRGGDAGLAADMYGGMGVPGRGGTGGPPSWWGGGRGAGGAGGAGTSGYGGHGGDGARPGQTDGNGGAANPYSIYTQNGRNGGTGAGGSGGASPANSSSAGTGKGGNGPGGGGSGGSRTSSTSAVSAAGADGNAWGGGTLIVIARVINILSTGRIYLRGGPGGNGTNGVHDGGDTVSAATGGGGGGGGGGGVFLGMYRETQSNAGSILVDGGIGGAGGTNVLQANAKQGYHGQAGYAGQIGTIRWVKIA